MVALLFPLLNNTLNNNRHCIDRASRGSAYIPALKGRGFTRNLIKHILLIHINAFTAEMLDELLTTYGNHGVKFISLEDALNDEAYRLNPNVIATRSYTFLNQVRLSRKMKNPKIVQELYDSFPEDKLSDLCIKPKALK